MSISNDVNASNASMRMNGEEKAVYKKAYFKCVWEVKGVVNSSPIWKYSSSECKQIASRFVEAWRQQQDAS